MSTDPYADFPYLAKIAERDPDFAARALARRLANPVPPVPRREPPLPSLASMAVSYTATMAEHVAAGMPKASPELAAARLAVCQAGAGLSDENAVDGHCIHYRPSDGRCGVVQGKGCGCVVRAAATLEIKRCPRGWWPDPGSVPPAHPG